jgi:uncharacterized protein (TIGR02001 family)
MKMKHKVLSTAVASALALGALAPAAHAEFEVAAEIGAANMYYWRGIDLGGDTGAAAVYGDLSVSHSSGFYAGLWTSSGDAALGTEYDIYFGYGTEVAGLGVDLSYATYVYPESEISPGDVAEVILGLSYGPAFVTYYHGLEDLEDYWYVNAGVGFGDFTFAYGLHEVEMAHIDVTYSFNENVSFTLGKVIDDVDGAFNDDPKFVVNFALPIEF